MPVNNSSISVMLDDLEKQVTQGMQVMQDALLQVGRMRSALLQMPRENEALWLQALLENHKEQIADAVANVVTRKSESSAVPQDAVALVYDAQEDLFRVGRRKIPLTKREQQVLALLWERMPAPVSREMVCEALYVGEKQPAPATVDVFVSNLRGKIKVLTDDTDIIRSVRGGGWSLRPEHCRECSQAAAGLGGDPI